MSVASGDGQKFVNVHHWAQASTGRGFADAVIACQYVGTQHHTLVAIITTLTEISLSRSPSKA